MQSSDIAYSSPIIRRARCLTAAFLIVGGAAVLPGAAAAETRTFTTPGTQSLTLPAGSAIYRTTISVRGAEGGFVATADNCTPGAGSLRQALFGLKPGPLAITVGGEGGDNLTNNPAGTPGGVGGGGNGGTASVRGGGGGGGASTVAVAGNPLLIAGGGGGCSGVPNQPNQGDGGDAGAPGIGGMLAQGGGAGTQTAGGAGGLSSNPADPAGGSGALGQGGAGAGIPTQIGGGGGGGGGYFGGGGGGGVSGGQGSSGGGGGGSDFVATSATNVVHTPGSGRGNGQVVVTFDPGCLVPKLKGRSLKRAKKALRKNGCKLGKVKNPAGDKVKKQKPKPGTVLAAGSKVKVTLG